MEKLLTVCIPTYNMEALLGRCLDSFILDQEYMDKLQILVVNDGSHDNSSKIGHEYETKYPNTFKVIDKPNGNYGSCVNAALKVASGKYFRICDADDKYDNANLKGYLSYLEKATADIVLSSYYVLSYKSEIEKKYIVPDGLLDNTYNLDDFSFYKNGCQDLRVMHCLATRTRKLIDNNYYQTEGISYTDTQYVFFSFLYAKTISFFSKVIYHYYLGRDGQTMSKEALIRSHMQLMQNAERLVSEYTLYKEPLSANKQECLMNSIFLEIGTFYGFVFSSIKNCKEQMSKLQELIYKSKESYNPCPIEQKLMSFRTYRWWKRYHIPLSIIRFLVNK